MTHLEVNQRLQPTRGSSKCRRYIINGHFSTWTWVSGHQNESILDFIGAKDDGADGEKWSCKTCNKTPVKLSAPAKQLPAFYKPDALPVDQPTTSEH